MADDKLRIVATVEDQFTGPLDKLKKGLKGVGDETAKHGASWRKDWAEARGEVQKFQGVLGGFAPILSAVGMGGFGAALSIGGFVTALKGFSGQTRDLSLMGRQIGMTVDQLRAFSALGGSVGVSADTMRNAIGSFAENMQGIKNRYGPIYDELRNMNLGSLVEELVSAPNMQVATEKMMAAIQSMPDSMKAARVSSFAFGTPDVATVVRNLGMKVGDALKQAQADIGHLDKATEEAARKFEENLSRMGRAAEKLKLGILGPALKGIVGLMDDAEKNGLSGNEQEQETRRLLSPLSGPEATPREKLEGRRAQVQQQLDLLEKGPHGADYQRKHDRMVEELKRVADELQRLRETGGSASISPSGYGGPATGTGSLIQKAAWGGGGFGGGGPLGGSAGSGPPGSGSGGSGRQGSSGGGSGGARDVPDAPEIGGGIRGRPFGKGGGPLGASPSGSAAGNLTALIEEAAKAAGVDPRILQGIRAGESHRRSTYDVKSDRTEDSYGPFQLNRRGGLGARFERETGLDLHDPGTIAEQARWVAKHLAKRFRENPNYNPGSEWFGYRGPRDADPRWGDSGYVPDRGGSASSEPEGSLKRSAGDVPPVDGIGGVEQRQGGAKHRRQLITQALQDQIAKAAREAGVNAEVFSGGQSEHGRDHYGSHRHDHGRSADLKLYTLGPNGRRRYLSMNNPADQAIMETFIRGTVRHGATGVGAGPGYMGESGIHIGGGPPAAWGARGRSANAPDWVRRAHRDGMADRAAVPRRDREADDGLRQMKPWTKSPPREPPPPDNAALDAYRAEREKRARSGEVPGEEEDDAAGYAKWKAGRRKPEGSPAPKRPEDQPVEHEPTAYERWRARRGKVGDALMDRFYGKGAVAGGPAMQMPGAAAGGGKGKLDIHLHGFPAGAQAQASMDGLFKETNVSKGRAQMDMDRA